MQRTLEQIEKKIEKLQERIIKRVKAKGIYENLGRKEQAVLAEYIGSITLYVDLLVYKEALDLYDNFCERCRNYCWE